MWTQSQVELQEDYEKGERTDPDYFARNNNLSIVVPAKNELQVDIDSPTLPTNFDEQLKILKQVYGYQGHHITRSRSGNLHVSVRLVEDIDQVTRGLLQACLGSDIKRELLTFKQHKQGHKRPQFFYEKNVLLEV